MVFKPRIFISSTLKENLSIRNELKDFYKSVGAESILYEKDLTPSIHQMTYRKDILDADFIIFIIKDEYGQETDKGISGTHEEFKIALDTNIPKHVYIKLGSYKQDAKKIIDEINNNQISYYYFHNDEELLSRIKETTFTIAKEIMLKKIEDSKLSKRVIKKLIGKSDYDTSIEIMRIIEFMINIGESDSRIDWVNSTLFDDFIEPLTYDYSNTFIDKQLQNIFEEMLEIYGKYNHHCNDYTTQGNHFIFTSSVLGNIIVRNCKLTNANPKYSKEYYKNVIKEFLEKYREFKKLVGKLKIEVDIL